MDVPDNIDPASLPISNSLKNSLDVWASTFDATLNTNDPASSGFDTAALKEEFNARGLKLFKRLKLEMPDINWHYFDIQARSVIT